LNETSLKLKKNNFEIPREFKEMTVEDYFTDELIYSERMCVADRKEIPSMASSNVNDSDTELLGRVLAGKKPKT
jgi:hypothetical protein